MKAAPTCNLRESPRRAFVLITCFHPGEFALSNYRLYRLDGAGKITNAEWIEAGGDADALAEARQRAATGSFELWEKNRLVERYRPDSSSPLRTV